MGVTGHGAIYNLRIVGTHTGAFPATLTGPLPPGSWNTQAKDGQRLPDPTPGLALPPKPAQQLQAAWLPPRLQPFVGLRTMCVSQAGPPGGAPHGAPGL